MFGPSSNDKIRKYRFNDKSFPKPEALRVMVFGRQIEYIRKIQAFKTQPGVKSNHISQKRQTYTKAIKEFIDLYNVDEYYCDFHCNSNVKDDSFEVWYTTKPTGESEAKEQENAPAVH